MDNSREKWMKWIKNREKKFVPLPISSSNKSAILQPQQKDL